VADYATAVGFVQFDVTEREANGTDVRDVTIRTPGTEGQLIRVTLWPEFAEAEVEKGDFLAVDGKLEVREVDDKTFINLSANKLYVNGQSYSSSNDAPRDIVKKSARKAF